jgi:nitrite reductase/ring-hydroxylating ferredoxin subunit
MAGGADDPLPQRRLQISTLGPSEACDGFETPVPAPCGRIPDREGRPMSDLIEIAHADRVVAGEAIVVQVAEIRVAVFNVNGRLFAVHDGCVRCGTSLASGTLIAAEVCCPSCDWRYDVMTGRVNGLPSLQIETFAICSVGHRVMMEDPASRRSVPDRDACGPSSRDAGD